MKHETRLIYIVRSVDNEVIHKIFGILEEAEKYCKAITGVIDEWQVEFKVTE